MNKQFINNTMMQGSFFSVNKHLAKYLKSNDAALILSHLIYLQEHFFKGEEFYQQQGRLIEECNVTITVLKTCMKLLSTKGLISTEKKGAPARNYYTVNYSEINKIFGEYSSSVQSAGILSTSQQDITIQSAGILSTGKQESSSLRVYNKKIDNSKVNNNNNNNNNNIDNNAEYIRDRLIKDKLYYPGNKLPQGFKSNNDYVNYLGSQYYE